jgi:hypothetical protein
MATLYRYQTIDLLCTSHHLNLIEDVNMVRSGEAVWLSIGYATEIVKRQKGLNQAMILEYLQSFDETEEVAE